VTIKVMFFWFSLKLLYVYEIGMVKFEVRILQLQIVICYVMLRSEQLLPSLLI